MQRETMGKFAIYDALPCSQLLAQSGKSNESSLEDTVMSLDIVKKSLQACDQSKLPNYRYLNFSKPRPIRNKIPVRRRKTCLSLHERRKLGLYHLKRNGLKFNDVLPLNDLWKQYLSDVLNLETLQNQGFSCLPTDRAWDQVSMALYKADYHGALLEVTRSKCASLVAKKGIVLMDTKNTFKLLSEDNIVRTIPKICSVFSLVLNNYKFTIYGKSFCTRPAERSVKKLKSHTLADL